MPTSSPTASQVLAKARSYLGTAERPDGSNRTVFGSWYGMNGNAWCAMFVSYIFNHVTEGKGLIGGKHAWTPAFAKWFYDRGRWGTKPRRGAVVFFAFYGPRYQGRWKGIMHVGLVESVRSDGSVVCIEGNVGNRVKRIVRRANIAGYGYPKYSVAAPKYAMTLLVGPADKIKKHKVAAAKDGCTYASAPAKKVWHNVKSCKEGVSAARQALSD